MDMAIPRRSWRKRDRRITHPWHAVALAVAGIALAIALGAQAASNAIARTNPEIALVIFPWNGPARDGAVFQRLARGVKKQDDVAKAADLLTPSAQTAIATEPLSVRAMTVLLLARGNSPEGRLLLESAIAAHKRATMLQGIELQWSTARGDFAATVKALDRLLRVNPNLSEILFPQLAKALTQPSAVTELGRVLDGSADWHRPFLRSAALDRDNLVHLAELRARLAFRDVELDQALIEGLAADGKNGRAYALYRTIPSATGKATNLRWPVDYPPFDWRLADEPGLRAALSRDNLAIDVFVRSGQGGALATRRFLSPATPFTVSVSHSITPAAQVQDVRLQVFCAGEAYPLLERPFAPGELNLQIDRLPNGCRFVDVVVYARAYSGRSAIRGYVSAVSITS